jgi:hypothetical protein
VLAFASQTWDGWDYMPHAWPVWLDAADGTLLVGCVGPTSDGRAAATAEGGSLSVGQPVAVARTAMLSPTEGWLEGIRVDPQVRGLGVATDLQVAELHALAAHRPAVVRYATGARNEGSRRLGARHGFDLLVRSRGWHWHDPAEAADVDRSQQPNGFDEATQQAATSRRRALLAGLADAGLTLPPNEAGAAWRRISASATFAAAARLYELRPWTAQELTEAAFVEHVRRGEVLARHDGSGWANAILMGEALPAEDVTLHLSLLAGEGASRARLVDEIRRVADQPIRFRLPVSDASTALDEPAVLAAAGFEAWQFEQHILGRPLAGPADLPAIDGRRLVVVSG